MTDPRIESAAIALYVAVQPNHRTPEGWSAVKPIWRKHYEASAVAVIAAIDKAETIRTAEEMDALPMGVVVVTEQGGIWLKESMFGYGWHEPGVRTGTTTDHLSLPARVIHWGTE